MEIRSFVIGLLNDALYLLTNRIYLFFELSIVFNLLRFLEISDLLLDLLPQECHTKSNVVLYPTHSLLSHFQPLQIFEVKMLSFLLTLHSRLFYHTQTSLLFFLSQLLSSHTERALPHRTKCTQKFLMGKLTLMKTAKTIQWKLCIRTWMLSLCNRIQRISTRLFI